jgi:hypothetical protein
MVKILTNQMTALGMHLVLKCILITDWSVEKMNPDTIQNRILLDDNVSSKITIKKIQQTSYFS